MSYANQFLIDLKVEIREQKQRTKNKKKMKIRNKFLIIAGKLTKTNNQQIKKKYK